MKFIKLTQGLFAIVDDDMFDFLNKDKWHAGKDVRTYYAKRAIYIDGKQKMISMHREVLPGVKLVDHINGNGLDNRRENLRPATGTQSCANRYKQANPASSKYKGVYWDKQHNKFRARIRIAGKLIHLGMFLLEEDAARAYNKAAVEHFGEYSKLNML